MKHLNQEEKQYHPEEQDEYKIGFEGMGNADDFGHIATEETKKNKVIYIQEDKLPLLKENITDIIYHFTGINGLQNILHDNAFRLYPLEQGRLPQRDKYIYYMSTTRLKRGDSGFPLMCYEQSDKVRITLDGKLLNMNPNVYCKAFDFFAPDSEHNTTKQDMAKNHVGDFEFHRHHSSMSVESEDRIYSKQRYIDDAKKYITRIDIYENHQALLNSKIIYALQSLGLNEITYLYKEERDFDIQNKNCTQIQPLSLSENTILKETHESILYHVTEFDSLPSILEKGLRIGGYVNKKGKSQEDIYNPRVSQFNDKSCSLTRVSNFCVFDIKSNFVRLTIDGNALQNRGDVVIKPVYAFKDTVSPTGKNRWNKWDDFSEKEERVWKINDRHHDGEYLSNPQNYITSIDVFYSPFNDNLGLEIFQYHTLPHLPEWSKSILHYYDENKFNYPLHLKENIEYEVSPEEVDTSSFEIQNNLQPEIWRDNQLNPKLRLKLLDIADDFYNTLGISWVKPIDIILTGSICNFNWSKYSDIDLHIVLDYREVSDQTDFVKTFFDSKKNEWNETHKDLEMFGFPVELYVQDISEDAVSSGVYSLEKDEWIKEPDVNEMNDLSEIDDVKLKMAASSIMTLIDDIEDEYNTTEDKHQLELISDKIDHLCKKIKELRTNGLDKNGEMSISNLVYKVLRRTEYLDKIWKISDKIYDKVNSINEGKIIKEYLSKKVGKPLDTLLNGDYSYKSEMVNNGNHAYWNGKYTDKQKEYLVNYFGKLFPDYMLEKDITFEDEDEEGDYLEYWENIKAEIDYLDDEDEYNKNLYKDDRISHIIKYEYPEEINNFALYVAYWLSNMGNSAKYYIPNWFYLQPLDTDNGYKLLKNEWMVHFTDKDDEILQNNYFYGADLDTLSITLGGDRGDYVFAFDASILGEMIGERWGNDAKERPLWFGKNFIMFQGVGALFKHSGDGFAQIIADKNTIKHIIQVKNINDEYCVIRNDNKRPIFKNKDYALVIQWVINNFIQYHKKIDNGNFHSIDEEKTLTEGFRMLQYQDKIKELAHDMMRRYQSIRHYDARDYDRDYNAYYQSAHFRLLDDIPPIEVRVYYDEDDEVSFDGFFDEKYHNKYVKGLICLFFNDDFASANTILAKCQEFLNHELTHYLDDIRDKEKGLTKNNNYLSCPDDNNWLGWMCYVLLNETEWNAWQEETITRPEGGKENIKLITSYINYLKNVDFSDTSTKMQNLQKYIKDIMTHVFKKNYNNTPIDIVRNKLVLTLEKKLNDFTQHLSRKHKQLNKVKQETQNKDAIYRNLGEKLISLAMGYNCTKHEEEHYGDIEKFYGVITIDGKKYNVLAIKNAGMQEYSWDFTDFENVSISEYDGDFYDAMYDDDISIVDEEKIGQKAYEALKNINQI